MPRLPRKVPRRHRRPKPAQARHQSQPSALSATPATQNESRCDQVPRLPCETKVDVTKCHACHVKRRQMSSSATPATQSAAASPATKPGPSATPEPAQCPKCHACHANESRCHEVPRLPCETKIDVSKCHACATPAT